VDLVLNLKQLWRRRRLVAGAVVLAGTAAMLAAFQVSLLPPKLAKRSEVKAQGSIAVLVDSARSPLADSRRDLTPLTDRAGVFARLMVGGNVLARIAKATGIPPGEIDVGGPSPLPGEAPGVEGVPAKLHPYGISVARSGELPIITVGTRAPTGAEARALAAAAPAALRREVEAIQTEQDTPARLRVELRTLGPAQGGPVAEALGKKIALAIFFVVLAACVIAILAVPRLIAAWRDEPERSPGHGAFV
jgi:hypothetical protein